MKKSENTPATESIRLMRVDTKKLADWAGKNEHYVQKILLIPSAYEIKIRAAENLDDLIPFVSRYNLNETEELILSKQRHKLAVAELEKSKNLKELANKWYSLSRTEVVHRHMPYDEMGNLVEAFLESSSYPSTLEEIREVLSMDIWSKKIRAIFVERAISHLSAIDGKNTDVKDIIELARVWRETEFHEVLCEKVSNRLSANYSMDQAISACQIDKEFFGQFLGKKLAEKMDFLHIEKKDIFTNLEGVLPQHVFLKLKEVIFLCYLDMGDLERAESYKNQTFPGYSNNDRVSAFSRQWNKYYALAYDRVHLASITPELSTDELSKIERISSNESKTREKAREILSERIRKEIEAATDLETLDRLDEFSSTHWLQGPLNDLLSRKRAPFLEDLFKEAKRSLEGLDLFRKKIPDTDREEWRPRIIKAAAKFFPVIEDPSQLVAIEE